MPVERPKRFLLFSLGHQVYATEIIIIREIVRNQTLTPLPDAQRCIAGIHPLRDTIVNVIDVTRIVEIEGEEEGGHRKILIIDKNLIQGDGRNLSWFGLSVREVPGIVDIPEEEIEYFERGSRHIINDYMIGKFKLSGDQGTIISRFSLLDLDRPIIWIDIPQIVMDITGDLDSEEVDIRMVRLFNPYQIVKFGKKSTGSLT
jgi:chemotaxis signal transduction protein